MNEQLLIASIEQGISILKDLGFCVLTRDDGTQVIMEKRRDRPNESSEEEGKKAEDKDAGEQLKKLVGTCLAGAEVEPPTDAKEEAEKYAEVKQEEETEDQ